MENETPMKAKETTFNNIKQIIENTCCEQQLENNHLKQNINLYVLGSCATRLTFLKKKKKKNEVLNY